MKTKLKIIVSAVVLLGMIATMNSCKKENPANGYMTVKMTDAPANYLAVNVEVIGISAHVDNVGWVDLPCNAGVYDLLTLQNDVTATLASNVTLPVGKVSQVRLLLGANNSITTLTGTYDLKIPSGSESGLKVNLHEDIAPNNHVIVVLDFDAGLSVIENGRDSYSLKPVVKVESVTHI